MTNTISLLANDSIAAETAGQAANPGQFTLIRSGDLTQALTVSYTLSGTATSGVDYQNLPGTITFASGVSTATIDINPIDDNVFEGTETVNLKLTPSSNYLIGQVLANGTSIGNPFSITSNLTNADILTKLLGTTTGLSNITLTATGDKSAYGTFNNDPFNLGTGIVLSTGKVSDLVGANVAGDTSTDFGLTDPTGGYDPITLKIDFNTDASAKKVFFEYVFGSEEFTEFSGREFNDIFTFTLNGVNLAKLSDGKTATINDLTPSATPATWSQDYIDNPQTTGPLSGKVILDGYTKTLRFSGDLIPNAKNTLEIKIKDIGDGSLDSAVFLKGGSLGVVDPTLVAATVNITDNESAPTISIADVKLKEGNSGINNATFSVNLSNASYQTITVEYATADGTATAGSDYNKVDKTTLTFAPGETSKNITVGVIGDAIIEPNETFQVDLSNPSNAALSTAKSAIGRIINDDGVILSVISIVANDPAASETKVGETPNSGQFTLTRDGDLTKELTTNYTVTGTATNSEDYQTLPGQVTFAAGKDTVTIDLNAIDDSVAEDKETVILTLAANSTYALDTSTVAAVNITDNEFLAAKLISPIQNLLQLKGGSDKSLLKFTKMTHDTPNNSEVCAFVVDDDLGSIGDIKPGDAGYLKAAAARAQVIFSTLSNSSIDLNFDRNSQRHLNFSPNDRLEFCLIVNDTLDRVKADLKYGAAQANVLFSLPEANANKSAQVKFTAMPNNGGYQLAWEDTSGKKSDGDFNDLVLQVETLDNLNAPLGSGLQGKSEGEAIDLRSFAGKSVKLDTSTVSDASYNNYIGFYTVKDEQGTLENGMKPSDAGYAQAAIQSAIFSCFKSETKSDLTIAGGKILAPIVIANGTFNDFLLDNPQNKINSPIHAYFNYIGANTDGVDHFRLLGDNKFGVEDMYGGGDRDYNDLIVQIKVK